MSACLVREDERVTRANPHQGKLVSILISVAKQNRHQFARVSHSKWVPDPFSSRLKQYRAAYASPHRQLLRRYRLYQGDHRPGGSGGSGATGRHGCVAASAYLTCNS